MAKRSGSGLQQYQPDRGHFIWLDFDPQAGTEQAGRRPALVLSPQRYNVAVGLVIVCPCTNQNKGGSFEVMVPPGCKITGAVLSDHVRSLDWLARKAAFIGLAPQALIDEVVKRVLSVIDP